MREAGASEPGCFPVGRGPGAVRVVAQGALLAFWGARVEGDSVGDHGEDVGDIEVEPGGCPHGLECGIGGQDAGDLRQFRVVHVAELVIEGPQFPACGDAADLPGGLVRQEVGDQHADAEHRYVLAERVAEVAEPSLPFPYLGVDEQGGQWLAAAAEGAAQGVRAVVLQDLGRILAIEQHCLQVPGERPEGAVGAEGGFAPGGVAVEGDEDAGAVQVGGLADQGGLLAGQGSAAGGEPGVPARSAMVTAMASNGPSTRTGVAP